MDEHLKKLNRLPFELRIHGPGRALFPRAEYDGFLRHIASPEALSRADEEAFNVLIVGPPGCGKSRLINLLFNKIVAESKASAASVTRQIKTYSGTGLINLCQRKVNLIDTIGLCDSFISEDIVLKLIQESLRINFAYLDQVVVICSGRIEFRHAENIRQILEWLRYHKYKGNFTFIYNKVDQMAIEERENGVNTMCQFLGVQRFILREPPSEIGFFHGDQVRFQPRERPRGASFTIPKCFATGFPEAPFALSNDSMAQMWTVKKCRRMAAYPGRRVVVLNTFSEHRDT